MPSVTDPAPPPNPAGATPSATAQPRGRRQDALKNRERILQTASEAFARDGAASLNQIAKLAGVGPGTLYRHFPSRENLILAVYQDGISQLVGAVPALLEVHPPLVALRVWFRRLAGYVRIKHGLGEALSSAVVQAVVDETYAPVTGAVASLLGAAEREGTIRPGVDPADFLLLMGALWRVPAGAAGEAQAERILDLAINSLAKGNHLS
ncbi:MAG: TetR/AcrR family transcriptional regulator [Bifidobacteriaceae bacterium]|jgi:AcrR family transcriptional regulator|nr:TetR/AcrR family transcriptional regulator [Bifidobacteriaceae bacterium]